MKTFITTLSELCSFIVTILFIIMFFRTCSTNSDVDDLTERMETVEKKTQHVVFDTVRVQQIILTQRDTVKVKKYILIGDPQQQNGDYFFIVKEIGKDNKNRIRCSRNAANSYYKGDTIRYNGHGEFTGFVDQN